MWLTSLSVNEVLRLSFIFFDIRILIFEEISPGSATAFLDRFSPSLSLSLHITANEIAPLLMNIPILIGKFIRSASSFFIIAHDRSTRRHHYGGRERERQTSLASLLLSVSFSSSSSVSLFHWFSIEKQIFLFVERGSSRSSDRSNLIFIRFEDE